MTLTVTTQAELDAALQRGDLYVIIIDSPRGVWLHVTSNGINSATVEASGSATVEAWGSATVEAWGSATVRAWDSATVRASGSATVEARGSAIVEARDSATVRATPYVAVHIHSARATVTGGTIINVAALDLTDPQTWCDYHGVEVVDGIATVHKAVGDDWSTDRGTDCSPGSLPEAHDWEPIARCGNGLHFSPSPVMSRHYYPRATRYLAVGVAVADLIPLGGDKAKSPRVVRACVEVDIDGKEVDR